MLLLAHTVILSENTVSEDIGNYLNFVPLYCRYRISHHVRFRRIKIVTYARIIESLSFINPEFEASSLFPKLHREVCV